MKILKKYHAKTDAEVVFCTNGYQTFFKTCEKYAVCFTWLACEEFRQSNAII